MHAQVYIHHWCHKEPCRQAYSWCYFKGRSQSIHLAVPFITHLLSHILAALQVMVAIREDLRLHDGHDAMLAGGGDRATGIMTTDNSTSQTGFVSLHKLPNMNQVV